MTSPTYFDTLTSAEERSTPRYGHTWLLPFFIGLIYPFSFAPFHFPGLGLLSLALFYLLIQFSPPKHAFFQGLCFGLGFFGLGVSWVYVSIHAYGHLNPVLSGFITFLFILYLAMYTGMVAFGFAYFKPILSSSLASGCVFSALWILMEYARASLFTGFPWLLLGIGQFDSPFQVYLPLVGVYGTGLIACFTATCFGHALSELFVRRFVWLTAGLTILLSAYFVPTHWTQTSTKPISVGIIQANLSMRDKWDEQLFWIILNHYEKQVRKLLGTDLIVMPESAIPLPANYVLESLEKLHSQTKRAHSALIFGMPAVKEQGEESKYFNALFALGQAKGAYLKQHLVPFGEYIPKPFQLINHLLGLPDPGIKPGSTKQKLVKVHNHPIASLICYELAYAELLRAQLPQAEWIISLSDDGWFGHSLAMYQQLQMAQVRSLQTGRYQVVSNNDGRSSILDTQGQIVASLPAFTAEILKSTIYPSTGSTPWSKWGDIPILCLLSLFLCLYLGQTYLNKYRLRKQIT